jgi:hypothetical protein
MSKQPKCSKCQAPLIFARTANGRHMPLDKERDLSGSSRYAVRRDTDLKLHVRTLAPGEQPQPGVEHRHMPHWATCPERGQLPIGEGGRLGAGPPPAQPSQELADEIAEHARAAGQELLL